MTVIKVCGLTSVEEAVSVAGLGADIIGLVLAPSRRRISTQLAAAIAREVKRLPSPPAIAGVFVNEPAGNVNETAALCGLDIVQLSGDESWDYCNALKLPFIKVIHVMQSSSQTEVINDVEAGYKARQRQPFICMLDCKSDERYGGSGHSFDWNIAALACTRFPLMVAGGLSPANVRQLIRSAAPSGVDVSSGVESDGKKDLNKAIDFVRAVRLTSGRSTNNSEILKTLLCKGERYATR